MNPLSNLQCVVQAKKCGGVGLMRAKALNKSLLIKLAWRLITQGDATWATVVHLKYRLEEDGSVIFKHKQRSTCNWKGLDWRSDLLSSGLR